MNSRKALTLISALLFALAITLPIARADEHNQLSTISFDQPIQIPSASGHAMVLPPGTYRFQLAELTSNRNVVQLYDSDQDRLITSIPTIPTEFVATNNRDLTDHTLLTFAEGARDEPLTLIKWFYVDHNIGHEFVYSGPMQRQLSEERRFTVEAKPANRVPNGIRTARGF